MYRLIPLAFLLAVTVGCGDKPAPTQPVVKGGGSTDGHDHSDHDRDGMKLEDFGPHHAGLTAHMSKEENNLEIVLETTDKSPKPVALKLTEIKGKATRAGDGKSYDLVFKPGPKDERKTDKDGECSRFEAEAPWMKPDDVFTVTATIELAGKARNVVWKDFNPKKHSHKHDEKK